MLGRTLEILGNVFRFHKKKIVFFIFSFLLCFVLFFPFDDLSDFITLQVSKITQSNVYLQFDGLSFGLIPQLGIKMENVVIESLFAPTLSVKTLGFAPHLTSLIAGQLGGKLRAYGLFNGDASLSFGPSRQLDIDGPETGLEIQLENIQLKELSKFLKESYQLPISMSGETQLNSNLYIDPSFKESPKGDLRLSIKQLSIPSSNIALGDFGMSMPFPALKLSEVLIVGNINDRKLFIKEGKIGDIKNDLHGEITGDIFFDIQPGGKFIPAGYDLKINLNVSENLKRQLGTVLGFVDIYQNIGQRHKFDSLQGIRYSMRLTARTMNTPPRVSAE